jgi:hypothetical protein
LKKQSDISRLVLIPLIVLAYLAATFGSVTHELSHLVAGSRSSTSSSVTDSNHRAKSEIARNGSRTADTSGSFCFFCAHSSNVLPVETTISFDLLSIPPGRLEYPLCEPIFRLSYPLAQLRAPPSLA